MKEHARDIFILLDLFLAVAGTQPVQAGVGQDNLLFYASFDGTLKADRAAGRAEPVGRPVNLRFADGVHGRALILNGDMVRYGLPKNLDPRQGSAAFWIKPLNWDPTKDTKQYFWFFAANRSGATVDRIQFFKLPNPVLYFMFGRKDRQQELLEPTGDWAKGQWRCFVLTWDADWMKLFVDGSLKGKLKTSAAHLPVDVGEAIQLGSDQASAFDELRIFNRVLSEEEVKTFYLTDRVTPGDRRQSAAGNHGNDLKVRMVIPKIKATPVHAKELDWEKFNGASRMSGFLMIPQLEYTPRQTFVQACYDAENLYLLLSSNGESAAAKETKRDGPVWLDDSYEIFLAPERPGQGRAVYQLVVNRLDTRFDARNGDEKWSGTWQSKSRVEPMHDLGTGERAMVWHTEVILPLREVGLTGALGEKCRFNFGRNWKNPDVFTNPTFNAAYSADGGFGTLIFGGEREFVRNDTAGRLGRRMAGAVGEVQAGLKGKYAVSLRVKKADRDLTDKMSLASFAAIAGKVVAEDRREAELKPGESLAYDFSKKLDDKGLYFQETAVRRGPEVLFYQVIPFKVADLLAVDLAFLSAEKKLNVLWELGADIGRPVTVTARIAGSDGKAVATRENSAADATKGQMQFDLSLLTGRSYSLTLTAKSPLTEVTQTQSIQSFLTAPWLGFERRMLDRHVVPPPWTPIRADDRRVKTLMQTYRLGDGPLPAQVSSQGHDLLAGPVTLDVRRGERKIHFTPEARAWPSKADDKVTFTQELKGETLDLDVKAACEFDGMLRFDVTLLPKSGQTTSVTGLTLEVPIKEEFARLKLPYFDYRQKYSVFDLDCTVGDYWSDYFTPHLWLGNDERGVSWFAETDERFNLADESKAIEIVRRNGVVMLRVNMINRRTNLTGPLVYTFGLMATPSRPPANDWFSHRFGSCVSTSSRPIIGMSYTAGPKYHVKKGVPYPAQDPAGFLKSFTPGAPGMKNLVYATCNGVGSKVPEYVFYGQEWQNPNSRDTWSYMFGGEYHDGTCPVNSSWRDFFLDACARARDEYRIDGLYYDYGTVMGCSNGVHGCGYDRDGQRRVTWPIFADRELRKNIYLLFSEGNRRPYFVLHNYSKMVAPIASFCNMVLDAEMYQTKTGVIGAKVSNDYSQLIPMARLRTMFGTQFGTTPVFLAKFTAEDEKVVKPTRTILAMTLPCGIQVWGFYCNIGELNKAYGAQDAFQFADSEFVPYWKQNGAIRAEGGEILAGYWKKKNTALVVLSNLTGKKYLGTLRVDETRLFGVDGQRFTATDAFRGEEIAVKDHRMPIAIDDKDYRMLLLHGGGTQRVD